ncbi:hypothetical protein VIGAN_01464400 [Vigna angularis var. angularis]|uniref:Uncharacterized protein n=1 Tax=Vigna angularis var. angularis TaxID=157739 RepID=A0A0S3R7T2_PHAAN|nr:hypothetical protein VIGAN_01464400 [Vigna angularis var. angularis]
MHTTLFFILCFSKTGRRVEIHQIHHWKRVLRESGIHEFGIKSHSLSALKLQPQQYICGECGANLEWILQHLLNNWSFHF